MDHDGSIEFGHLVHVSSLVCLDDLFINRCGQADIGMFVAVGSATAGPGLQTRHFAGAFQGRFDGHARAWMATERSGLDDLHAEGLIGCLGLATQSFAHEQDQQECSQQPHKIGTDDADDLVLEFGFISQSTS